MPDKKISNLDDGIGISVSSDLIEVSQSISGEWSSRKLTIETLRNNFESYFDEKYSIDNNVVHLQSTETIIGQKTFDLSPLVPEATNNSGAINLLQLNTSISSITNQLVNKANVDGSNVTNFSVGGQLTLTPETGIVAKATDTGILRLYGGASGANILLGGSENGTYPSRGQLRSDTNTIVDWNETRTYISTPLGVGVSPDRMLDVMGSPGLQLRLRSGTSTFWDLGRNPVGGHFQITEDSGLNVVDIDPNTGYLGVGKVATQMLDVNGHIQTQKLMASGNLQLEWLSSAPVTITNSTLIYPLAANSGQLFANINGTQCQIYTSCNHGSVIPTGRKSDWYTRGTATAVTVGSFAAAASAIQSSDTYSYFDRITPTTNQYKWTINEGGFWKIHGSVSFLITSGEVFGDDIGIRVFINGSTADTGIAITSCKDTDNLSVYNLAIDFAEVVAAGSTIELRFVNFSSTYKAFELYTANVTVHL